MLKQEIVHLFDVKGPTKLSNQIVDHILYDNIQQQFQVAFKLGLVLGGHMGSGMGSGILPIADFTS